MQAETHSPQFNEIWAILQETAQRQRQFEIDMEKRRVEEEKRRAEAQVQEEKRRAEEQVEEKKRRAEDTKSMRELREQLGGLGNKFGSFTEGMAFPSMEKVLRKRFGMTTVTTRYKTRRDNETIEIDVLGLANGALNTVMVVEVKSHFKERDIEQMLRLMDRFTEFFPEHKGKKLYGIMAYVDGSEETRQMALNGGFYVAHIHDEIFDLDTVTPFIPRDFSQPA